MSPPLSPPNLYALIVVDTHASVGGAAAAGPPASGPGAVLPTNLPTPAKPAKAKTPPPEPYTDSVMLRYIFRFAHGIPADANLEALTRATLADVVEATKRPSVVPDYLREPAVAPSALDGDNTPSWPVSLGEVPAKTKWTLGSIKATLKMYCSKERVSVRTHTAGEDGARRCQCGQTCVVVALHIFLVCRCLYCPKVWRVLGRPPRGVALCRAQSSAGGPLRSPAALPSPHAAVVGL